ncbi:MAG: tetratricopeptide repeat protein [Pseudomonadota bacterium]|nr:tetratricopeptide repeat protein [Pseudomonadota bacterium]
MTQPDSMVQDSVIGLYRANITSTARLVSTSVGRSELLDDLLDKLRRRGAKKSGQHMLLIGPRGIGKTHLLNLLQYGLEQDPKLTVQFRTVRFPEENNRLLSFADLLLGIVEILGSGDGDDQWAELYRELHVEEDDVLIIDRILPRLKQWCQESGNTLLLLMENLDVLVTQQIKKPRDIHRLRSFLMDSPHVLLVATSPAFFPGLNDVRHPLYDFFDIQVIGELEEAQTLELIRLNLEWDGRRELLERFDKLVPRIRALHTMTGGNPRLTMMLYELIGHEKLLEVRTQFHKLLDGISPFYQDRIKELPAQERAVLETLALMREEPRTPARVARRLRKSAQQTSTLLKRMTDAGYLSVSPNPEDKRSRLYRIKEGFFDIWLAMSQSRVQRRYLPYLVDFFTRWYAEPEEREEKRCELRQKLEGAGDRETLDYLTEVGPADERTQAKLDLAVRQLRDGLKGRGVDLLHEVKIPTQSNGIFIWMHEQARRWAGGELEPNIRKRMEGMIEYWQEQRSGRLETAARLAHELGMDFTGSGLHRINIALQRDLLRGLSDPAKRIVALHDMSRSQFMDGQIPEALRTFEEILEASRRQGDRKQEGIALNNISQIYDARGDYDTALGYLKQSLAIQQEIGDKSGEGTTLNNISQIFRARGDYDTALGYLKQSLAIRQEIGDKSGEGTTLNNISQIFRARGDYDTALGYLKQSLAIQQEIGDKSGEGTTLFNMGHIHLQNEEVQEAVSAWVQAYRLARPMQLAQALDALAQLADRLGLAGGLQAWDELSKKTGD